jgi:LEA14-like dessication related protein
MAHGKNENIFRSSTVNRHLGCTDTVNYRLREPACHDLTPLEQKYHIKVRLQNPNDHAIEISGMSYVLEVNGQPLLKGVSDESVTVPRFSESILELSGVSTLFGFVRQFQALQERETQGMQYKLSGKLSLNNRFGSVPFNYEGTLLPPSAP